MKTLQGLKLANSILASNLGYLNYPYKLNIMVTNRCNQKCLHCGIWKKEVHEELTVRELRTFFKRSGKFSWVDVSGGEIILRPDILDVFGAIIEECPKLYILHFATNGSIPEETEFLVKKILALGSPRLIVTVSLDGPPEIHNSMRGTEGAYDRAIDTFQRLSALAGCRTYLGMTLTAQNAGLYEDTLAGVRARLPKVTPADLHVNFMHRSDHHYGCADAAIAGKIELKKEIETILKHRHGILSPMNLLERRYLSAIEPYLENGAAPIPCNALSATCFLDTGGTVYPCISWDKPLGNIRDHGYDLTAILRNRKAVTLSDIRNNLCPGCWTPCEAVPAILGNLLPIQKHPDLRRTIVSDTP